MKIWGKRHIIIVSKMTQFWIFGSHRSRPRLWRWWRFKLSNIFGIQFFDLDSIKLIPYEGFELFDYALRIHTVLLFKNFELDALWSLYILNKMMRRVCSHSSLCFCTASKLEAVTNFNFWSIERNIICDIVCNQILKMLDLTFLSRAKWFYVTHIKFSHQWLIQFLEAR